MLFTCSCINYCNKALQSIKPHKVTISGQPVLKTTWEKKVMVRKCRPQNTEYNISSSALLLWKMANELYLLPLLFGHQIIFELLALLKLLWICQSNCWSNTVDVLFDQHCLLQLQKKKWGCKTMVHRTLTITITYY